MALRLPLLVKEEKTINILRVLLKPYNISFILITYNIYILYLKLNISLLIIFYLFTYSKNKYTTFLI
jgi:hypothetical protein